MFKTINTKRSSEKGQEYSLHSDFMMPTTFFKYLDHEIINLVEIDLRNKRQITIHIKQGVSQKEVVDKLSNMLLIFIDNHFVQQDTITGPYFIEKVKEEVYPMPKGSRKKSKYEIKEEIKSLQIRLDRAVSRENYTEAAKLRDQIQELSGKETSI